MPRPRAGTGSQAPPLTPSLLPYLHAQGVPSQPRPSQPLRDVLYYRLLLSKPGCKLLLKKDMRV